MPLVQFEIDYKRLMLRYKQAPEKETCKVLAKVDEAGKRLANPKLPADQRDSLVNKLEDLVKKVKLVIKEELKERRKEFLDAVKKPPTDFDAQAGGRTLSNVSRELMLIQAKLIKYAATGGKPPPPPKLPEFHYSADYKSIITRHEGALSPAVANALDRLDETNDAAKAVEMMGLARAALEKQTATITAQAAQSKDAKEKVRLTALVKELNEFRKAMKQLETRIFLINRLKG